MKAFFLKILPFNFSFLLCLVLGWSLASLFCLAQLQSLCVLVHFSNFLSDSLFLPHSHTCSLFLCFFRIIHKYIDIGRQKTSIVIHLLYCGTGLPLWDVPSTANCTPALRATGIGSGNRHQGSQDGGRRLEVMMKTSEVQFRSPVRELGRGHGKTSNSLKLHSCTGCYRKL